MDSSVSPIHGGREGPGRIGLQRPPVSYAGGQSRRAFHVIERDRGLLPPGRFESRELTKTSIEDTLRSHF